MLSKVADLTGSTRVVRSVLCVLCGWCLSGECFNFLIVRQYAEHNSVAETDEILIRTSPDLRYILEL